MAGSDPRFDPVRFRDAIHFAMTMGLPPQVSHRATFKWIDEVTGERPRDPSGYSYDLNDPAETVVTRPPVQIPVAVEYEARPSSSRDTTVGAFDLSRATLTILDTEIDQVRDANYVEFEDATYRVKFWGPPMGLFEVGVFQVYVEAVDEL